MLSRVGRVLYWLEAILIIANVGIGIVLAVKFQTWNPVITGGVLAAICWSTARTIRYVITGK